MSLGTRSCAGSVRNIRCEDGYTLRYRAWPACGNPIASLFLANGMMSHSGWFEELASALSESRINVIGADRRGSGLNETDRGNAPSRHVLLSDFRNVIEHEDCGVPVYVAGWCWGAVLAVNAALEFGHKFSGLVLLAPGLFPSEQINHAVQSQFIPRQDSGTAPSLIQTPITEEMFTDKLEFREFISHDALAVHEVTPQFLRVSQQMQLVAAARLSQLTTPVLLLLAAADQAVNNEKTRKAFQRLPSRAVSFATLACNHGMQFEAPQEVAGHITDWLARRVPASRRAA
jgi:alpha-beta hydrolase superfamily lysophospholipase